METVIDFINEMSKYYRSKDIKNLNLSSILSSFNIPEHILREVISRHIIPLNKIINYQVLDIKTIKEIIIPNLDRTVVKLRNQEYDFSYITDFPRLQTIDEDISLSLHQYLLESKNLLNKELYSFKKYFLWSNIGSCVALSDNFIDINKPNLYLADILRYQNYYNDEEIFGYYTQLFKKSNKIPSDSLNILYYIISKKFWKPRREVLIELYNIYDKATFNNHDLLYHERFSRENLLNPDWWTEDEEVFYNLLNHRLLSNIRKEYIKNRRISYIKTNYQSNCIYSTNIDNKIEKSKFFIDNNGYNYIKGNYTRIKCINPFVYSTEISSYNHNPYSLKINRVYFPMDSIEWNSLRTNGELLLSKFKIINSLDNIWKR